MNIEKQKKDNYTMFDKDGKFKKGFAEVNSGEVLTLENEAYTIREMLEKFTTGVFNPQSVMLNQEEVEYTDDMMNSEVPEFIDRTDVQEYVDTMNQRKKAADAALNRAARKKEKSASGNDEQPEGSEDKPDEQQSDNPAAGDQH